jgi:hypothetical protein
MGLGIHGEPGAKKMSVSGSSADSLTEHMVCAIVEGSWRKDIGIAKSKVRESEKTNQRKNDLSEMIFQSTSVWIRNV